MIAALDVTMQPVSPCNKPVDIYHVLFAVLSWKTLNGTVLYVYNPARTVLVCKFTFCLESY
jgi:hypothetical protein